MFTLPTGHPSHARVSSGISAGAEVVQPAASAPRRVTAKKTKTAARAKATEPKAYAVEVPAELDEVEPATPAKDDIEE